MQGTARLNTREFAILDSSMLSINFWHPKISVVIFEAFELHAGPEGSQLKHVCSDKCDFGLMTVTKVKARNAIIQGKVTNHSFPIKYGPFGWES
jgi:hypothetical protein